LVSNTRDWYFTHLEEIVEVTAGGGKELGDKRPPLQVYIPRQCEKILEIYQIGKDYIIVI